MKRLLACLMLLMAACSLTNAPTGTTSAPLNPTKSDIPASATAPGPTPTAKPPDLDHHPLYWFAPLAPMPQREGRMFNGSDDFMKLFELDAPWETAASNIQVFKLYGEWVGNHPNDLWLRQVIADLNRRGMAIAIEAGPLDPENCGEGIEGFASIAATTKMLYDIKNAGGRLAFISMDEPYFFAHYYDGPNACHWSIEKVAMEVDQYVQAVHKIDPDIIVGDTEPLAGGATPQGYNEWLDTFREVNGYDLTFLHLDIDWARADWAEQVKTVYEHGQEIGVPIGIIYNGNNFDPTDKEFLMAAGQRVKKLEIETGVTPDHILFQSWVDKPDRALPESEAYTWTGFIKSYFEDKSLLGYQSEGEGANLALGKPVRFSSQMGDHTGAMAVDGDTATYWGVGGFAPQWLEVDLGAEYSIAWMRLVPSQYPEGRTVHLVKGKGANAGAEFVMLYTFDGNTRDGDEMIFTPEAAITGIRYLRIETVDSPSWVAWREIQVFQE